MSLTLQDFAKIVAEKEHLHPPASPAALRKLSSNRWAVEWRDSLNQLYGVEFKIDAVSFPPEEEA